MLEEATRPWSPSPAAFDLAPHQFRIVVKSLLLIGVRIPVFQGDLLTRIMRFVGKHGAGETTPKRAAKKGGDGVAIRTVRRPADSIAKADTSAGKRKREGLGSC
jgi:hypothetical protein